VKSKGISLAIRSAKGTLTKAEIAAATGGTLHGVNIAAVRLRKKGFVINFKRPDFIMDQIQRLADGTLTQREIAETVGTSYIYVRVALHHLRNKGEKVYVKY
jgi:CRP-like cAMP-binding protein